MTKKAFTKIAFSLFVAATVTIAGCKGGGGSSTPSTDSSGGSSSSCSEATSWPSIQLTKVATGVLMPTSLKSARDGSGRLFVTEQKGRVKVIKNGQVLSTPFIDLTDRVYCRGAGGSCYETGMFDIEFPNNYSQKGYFYLSYMREPDGASVLSRMRVNSSNPDVADPSTEEEILVTPQPNDIHNGGQIKFGPDGYLYYSLGDGGPGMDPNNTSQDPSKLLGKLMRIDVEGGQSPYSVPSSNPFVGNSDYRPEIFALGLRNPWRFSFDSVTGDIFIGDVGQNQIEEIDFISASSGGGQNFGWSVYEGTQCFKPELGCNNQFTNPIIEYTHSIGISVTGGYVYRGSQNCGMYGVYFYADYNPADVFSARIWGARQVNGEWSTQLLYEENPNSADFFISSFGEGEDGELYVVQHQISEDTPGAVWKISMADGSGGSSDGDTGGTTSEADKVAAGALAYAKFRVKTAGGSGEPTDTTDYEYARCKACHGWDLLANQGGYVRRDSGGGAHPAAMYVSTALTGTNYTADQIWNSSGRAITTHDDTHPNYVGTLTEDQVNNLVAFLNSSDSKFDQYGTMDTTKTPVQYSFPGADTSNGESLYGTVCERCHGLPTDASNLIGMSFVDFLKQEGAYSETAFFIRWGNPGTSMTKAALGNLTAAQTRDILAYLKTVVDAN